MTFPQKASTRILSLSVVVLLFVLGGNLQAQSLGDQESKKGFSKDRIFTGGNFGLWFGSTTFIDISPLLGYWVTDEYAVGLGGTYIYYKTEVYDFNKNPYELKTSYYGGRVFNRYFFMENIFAHGEYELLSLEYYDYAYRNTGYEFVKIRKLVGSLLVGGGYAQRMGRNSQWFILVLYNLNDHLFSPYPNPVVRVGMTVGF